MEPQDNETEEDIIITARDIILEPFSREGDRVFKETMVGNLPTEKDEEQKKKHHGKHYFD